MRMKSLFRAVAALLIGGAAFGATLSAQTRAPDQIGGSAHFGCGSGDLRLLGADGVELVIPFGGTGEARIAGGRVLWRCGDEPGEGTCPIAATRVRVIRSELRSFELQCLS